MLRPPVVSQLNAIRSFIYINLKMKSSLITGNRGVHNVHFLQTPTVSIHFELAAIKISTLFKICLLQTIEHCRK